MSTVTRKDPVTNENIKVSANILDQFQTYSYHHILIACSNQQVVEDLSSALGNDIAQFQQVQSVQPILARPTTNDQGIEIPGAQIGQFFVIINGLKDTGQTIESVDWETVIAGNVNASDMGNSLAVSGSMTIREARGFNFLNVMNIVADEFQTDPIGIVYLLKTIFVGHSPDGVEGQRIISNLVPLRLSFIHIDGSFTAEGGTYDLKFVAASNGMSRYPQFSRGAEGITLTPNSRVLTDVLGDLAAKMNKNSQKNYNRVVKAVKERLQDSGGDPNEANKLRRVEYQIVADGRFLKPRYIVSEFDPGVTEEGSKDSPAALAWGNSFTVEQAIQDILRRTKEIQNDINTGDEQGRRYRYKIHSEVTMQGKPTVINANANKATSTDVEVLLVKYTVRPFLELTSSVLDKILNNEVSGDGSQDSDIRNSLVEFDYFFTGKNVDIIKFDIKIQQGVTFLQTLHTTDNTQTAIEQQKNGVPGSSVVATNSITQKSVAEIVKRIRTPVFPSTDVKDVLTKNIGNPIDTTAFNAALSRHASIEQIRTIMEIRGNPYLMSTTSTPISDKTDENNSTTEPDASRVMVNWDRVPSLVKVNIMMPENSDSPSGKNLEGESPKLIPFWYKGFYFITKMRHKFSGGEFTQNITMHSVLSDDLFQLNNSQEISEEKLEVDDDAVVDDIIQELIEDVGVVVNLISGAFGAVIDFFQEQSAANALAAEHVLRTKRIVPAKSARTRSKRQDTNSG